MKKLIYIVVFGFFALFYGQAKGSQCPEGASWTYEVDKTSPASRSDVPNGKNVYNIKCLDNKLHIDGFDQPKLFSFFVPTVAGLASENPWFKPEGTQIKPGDSWKFSYNAQTLWNGEVVVKDPEQKSVAGKSFLALIHVREDWTKFKNRTGSKKMTYSVAIEPEAMFVLDANIEWENGTKITLHLKEFFLPKAKIASN